MAEIRGIVVKRYGERAEIKVNKAESELTGLPKYLDCWNPIGAKAGDVVGAEYREGDQTKAKLIVYGLPVQPGKLLPYGQHTVYDRRRGAVGNRYHQLCPHL